MENNKTYLLILTSLLIFVIIVYSNSSNSNIPASILVSAQTQTQNTTLDDNIAEKIHKTETFEVPPNIGSFVMLIANEAHESWADEKHKLITDKNAYTVPTNLVLHEGTSLVFLNADAPWDTPHPHNIELAKIGDAGDNSSASNGNDANPSTGLLQYADYSRPFMLEPGKYLIRNTGYDTKEGTITVIKDSQIKPSESPRNVTLGGFYTPTNIVEDNKDNDGNTHPGSLGYFLNVFEENGFEIVSKYNFTYAACDYCPGKFWPDNKSANHTLFIYETTMSLNTALDNLKKLVKDNVYV
jgi:hypothetical protein